MAKDKPVRDPVAAKERLAGLSEGLERALADPDSGYVYLSEEDAAFLQNCFHGFLSGREKSLDEAFQVKRPRGAPKMPRPNDKTRQRAKAAIFRDAKSWKDVADDEGIDPRSLQRTAERHEKAILREIADALIERRNAAKLLSKT